MAKIKTKARALDMLGRQQIAGIPTALSELFKNAHDAYADNVEVDYIRKKSILILRDDGLGMTQDEFEQRWLTIGTSSKLDDENSIEKPAIDDSKKKRQIMGEKGIGRLSIAAIGPQVLVFTRAKRDTGLGPLIAAFVNWTFFSIPSLDLEDIEIPIEILDDGKMLSKDCLALMIDKSKKNLHSLSSRISRKRIVEIENQLDSFDYDPIYWEKALGGMHLSEDGYGTHFIISPVDEVIDDDIEQAASNKDQSSRLEKALLGFTNTMYDLDDPAIIARFRDHTLTGECIDRISEKIFFTPDEFNLADHHIEGTFNEFGQFIGHVTVYGEEKIEHIVSWPEGLNKPTHCGPFRFKLAYIQGRASESKLPNEIWSNLNEKTSRYGGLYIYRDGIRVLPYGDTNNDFLNIEYRRSKSAGDYFFSLRRMFGAIEITKEKNYNLHEKAGREGFIENKAYKQFRSILEHFFIQTASDIFNKDGDLSGFFIKTKDRQLAESELLRKRSTLTSTKKKKLEKELDSFFNKLDHDYWKVESRKIKDSTDLKFQSFEENNQSIDQLVFTISKETKATFDRLKNSLEVKKPAGIGLNKNLLDLWDRYQSEKDIQLGIINDANDAVTSKLIEFEVKYSDRIALRNRLHDSLALQQKYFSKEVSYTFVSAQAALKKAQQITLDTISESKIKLKEKINQVEYDFNSVDFSEKSSNQLFELKKSLEEKIETTSREIIEKISQISSQIKTINYDSEENFISSNKLTESLETELEHLREQHDNNLELVNLGMALGVVHHEFNGNIRSIRSALRDFKPWADRYDKLGDIYVRLRTGFDHLDGYLKTFTPLNRRLSRTKVNITGDAIFDFIKDVFQERFEKDKIELKYTDSFYKQSLFTYTSTIYPVFVNLIDNATYWLAKTTGERCIIFDATGSGFIIKDSGPGISTRDREAIFDMGFSRKIGGRGMGLFISREILKSEGFILILEDYHPNEGASFIIEPIQGQYSESREQE